MALLRNSAHFLMPYAQFSISDIGCRHCNFQFFANTRKCIRCVICWGGNPESTHWRDFPPRAGWRVRVMLSWGTWDGSFDYVPDAIGRIE